MKRTMRSTLLLAAALGVAACSDTTTPALISDAQVTTDVAKTSGDAIASDVIGLIANEVGLPLAPPAFDLLGSPPVETRTRVCYDAQNVVVVNCLPLTSVRKITMHWTVDGSRSGDHFTASVHRIRDLTVVRNFTGQTETSRTHDGVGSSTDTTVFTGEAVTRTSAESAVDSVIAVVFNLPHANNPWPVSGKIVRRVTGHVTVQGENRSESRDFTRRVEVTFPADAQGNVTINVNGKTCTLNLVTRVVNGCS